MSEGVDFINESLETHNSLVETEKYKELTPQTKKLSLDFSWVGTKLFGRSKEEAELVECYNRLRSPAAGGEKRSNLILISGNSGVGKSALAQTLRDRVSRDGGFFITGKFDQLQRREPYPAFVEAFTELTNLLVSEGEQVYKKIRKTISQSIEADGRILIDMIPALERIMGENSQAESAQGAQSMTRFIYVFRLFLRAICSREQPIVLVLDDLHWADPCSLDLLLSLVREDTSGDMIFLATYRTDTALHETFLEFLEQTKTDTTSFALGNLAVDDIAQMVSYILVNARDGFVREISEFLIGITGGNPFHALELLRYLEESGQLMSNSEHPEWRWKVENRTLSVVKRGRIDQLIQARLKELLPLSVQEVLSVAACLGFEVNVRLLSTLLSLPISDHLSVAAECGFLAFDLTQKRYSFAQDECHAAAYSLVENQTKPKFHVMIGSKLVQRLEPDELQTHIYVVLDQFQRGSSHITSQIDRYKIANICLSAAEKAVMASSFRTAADYLNFGMSLLGGDHWDEEYGLSLALHDALAEVEYRTANFTRVDELISAVFNNARSFHDTLQAHATQIYALGAKDKMQEAIDSGLQVLSRLGEAFSPHPSNGQILVDIMRTKRLLGRKTNEALLRLPLVSNVDKLSAMQFLNAVFLYVFFDRPKLAPLIAMRLVRLTAEYGLSAFSSVGFAAYGMVLCGIGKVQEGFEYGRIALSLLDTFETRAWEPRVYAAVYGVIHSWTRPLRETLKPLRHAYQVGLETGDIEFALLDASLYCFHLFDIGRPLHFIQKELMTFRAAMKVYKQDAREIMIQSFAQKVNDFLEVPDVCVESPSRNSNVNNSYWTHFNRMTVDYVFGNYEAAVAHGNHCRDRSQISRASFDYVSVAFFDALSLAALYQQSGQNRRKTVAIMHRHIRLLRQCACLSPVNVLGKLYLLQAEVGAIQGKRGYANCKYISSIALATENANVLEHSIANERAGRWFLDLGDKAAARSHLHLAVSSYQQWGSEKKAKKLIEEFPVLLEPDSE